MTRTTAFRLTFVALIAWCASADAQVSRFAFDAQRVATGTALHYLKSGFDGSRATRISVYVADVERLESLKWNVDEPVATLVQARMDWQRFSVREFASWHLERGKAPELRGTLAASGDGSSIEVSFLHGKTIKIDRWPWHSYDFDFVSLGAALPHLRDPEVDVIFWRTDVVFVGEGTDSVRARINHSGAHARSLRT